MTPRTRSIVLAIVAVGSVAMAGTIWFIRGPDPMAFTGGQKVSIEDYRAGSPTGAPVSLVKASLVEQGKYLAEAADCVACHTSQGGKDFAGGLAIKFPFGTLFSTNITPDKDTGIGNYSDQEFLNAVQRGIRHDGARLYPAMPFTSYSYVADADALAIKAYLFSLPPVYASVPANTLIFPFNQRWAMGFWSVLFARDSRFEPDALQSPEWNRGAYLAEALAHCGECHTPRSLAMALNNRRKFAGTVTAGWRAFNISSDKNAGLGNWGDADIASYLSIGHADGHGTASGPMGEAVDHSLSKLVPEDVHAVVTYLRSVPAMASPEFPTITAAPASFSHRRGGTPDPRGKMVFESACASCHGWTGESPVSPFATLTGSWAVNDPNGTNVAQIVMFGTTRHTPESVISMPSFGNAYSDGEIAAVVNYVTARFGGRNSRLSAREISSLRKQATP
jgi:mono/diheme cytochrome c family protein